MPEAPSAEGAAAMTEGPIVPDPLRARSPLRTPRAAALAGIIFSVLLMATLVLLRLSVPARPEVPGAWLTDSGRRTAVAVALNIVPFAGIAFLWFIGVIRDRIGEREDRFFATVFLGSGLLFVSMLFVGAAIAGGLIAELPSSPPGPGTLALGRDVTSILLNVYAMRMAAVFTLTTVTIARRTEIVPQVAHRRRAGERTGAADRGRPLTLGGAALPGLDPGAEHRHPRGRPEGAVGGHPGSGAGLIAGLTHGVSGVTCGRHLRGWRGWPADQLDEPENDEQQNGDQDDDEGGGPGPIPGGDSNTGAAKPMPKEGWLPGHPGRVMTIRHPRPQPSNGDHGETGSRCLTWRG